MTPRKGIVCGGCWTLDRIKLVDRWPQEEELATIHSVDRQGGGSAHNLGVDMCRLDPTMPVSAIGLVGSDPDGDFLLQQARSCGMDTAQLQRSAKAETSYTDVYSVIDSGRRTFFHHPGTNDLLTPEHFDFSASTARILHLGLLGVHHCLDNKWNDDANGWVTVLKKAKSAGMQTNVELVSIAPERIRELCAPCLPYLDRLVVNDYEIGGLAGVATVDGTQTDIPACTEAARQVLQRGAMEQVIVHYPGGAVAVSHTGEWTVPSFTIAEDDIVSSVGAGDAFAAGVLYGWHEGWTTINTLRLGHAVAAASLRSQTTVGSVGTIEECLAYVGLRRSTVHTAELSDDHLQPL
ncbi:MAG: carbohydrate kinase family protein [Gammaproteobacteria bacterium]|nr:carbohydrate kinase family protein [Gammaproteobacteria bacterium]